MAVIKFKRGSGVPTGLTAFEAAWDTSAGRFFINNGSTAVWIGARIDSATDLGAAGSCAFFVPTQLAVKTYIDNQVAGGAVSSVNGLTGAVTGVAFLGTAQTFTQSQSFSAGISASGGITFYSALNTFSTINAGGTLTVSGIISSYQHQVEYGARDVVFTFDPTLDNDKLTLRAPLAGAGGGSNFLINLPLDNGTLALTKNTVSSVNGVTGATTVVSSLNGATGTVTIGAGTGLSVATSIASKGITLTNTGVLTNVAGSGISVSGATGNVTITNTGVTGLVAGTGISVSSATGNVTVTNTGVQSLNSATGAVSLFAGAGLSVASSSSIRGITFTNTGVLTNVAGSGISVSGATGNVTITNTGLLSFNGNIGAVQGVSAAVAGSGISVSGATGSVTITNTGVLSNVAGSGISVSAGTGNVTITNAGVTGLVAGTGISVSSATGNVTVTNIGVRSIAGTENQITASGATGAVTLSLPNAITTPGSLATTTSLSVGTDLTVTGNLTVNGTTTTVNSNTVTIQDPVIAIGGAGTTNAPPPTGDTKDRGIVFQWNNGLQSATGFFGHDRSTGYFTYIPNFVTLANDVVSGTAGTAQFNEVRGLSGVTFTITAPATTSSIIEMRGGAVYNNTVISLEAATVEIGNYGSRSGIRFTETGRGHLLAPASTMTANRTYDLPDHSGTIVVPSDLGSVAGYILTSQGATAQPVWIKPDDAGTGITASAAKLVTVSSSTDSTSFLTFIDTAAPSNQAIRYNSSLAYNASTNYLDVNIDCGSY